MRVGVGRRGRLRHRLGWQWRQIELEEASQTVKTDRQIGGHRSQPDSKDRQTDWWAQRVTDTNGRIGIQMHGWTNKKNVVWIPMFCENIPCEAFLCGLRSSPVWFHKLGVHICKILLQDMLLMSLMPFYADQNKNQTYLKRSASL